MDIVYILNTKKGLTSKRDFRCLICWSYILYLTKVSGIDFETAVLNIYYQMIQQR